LLVVLFVLAGFLIVIIWRLDKNKSQVNMGHKKTIINLPQPRFKSQTSIEEALLKRRSIREFKKQPVALMEISQLLWAAQGITEKNKGFRTAPSAGALYPLEVYIIASNIDGLPAGVYKYKPEKHVLLKIKEGYYREVLFKASFEQESVRKSAVIFVLSAIYERTTKKYGQRGKRYVEIEVGHAAQNVYLQATALNLGTVAIGAFDEKELSKILSLPTEEAILPLYMMAVGKKQ